MPQQRGATCHTNTQIISIWKILPNFTREDRQKTFCTCEQVGVDGPTCCFLFIRTQQYAKNPLSRFYSCQGVGCLSQTYLKFPVWTQRTVLKGSSWTVTYLCRSLEQGVAVDYSWEKKLLAQWLSVEINESWTFILAAVRWTKHSRTLYHLL